MRLPPFFTLLLVVLGMLALGGGAAASPPLVVVYPATAMGNLDPEQARRFSAALSARLRTSLSVEDDLADTPRTGYLEAARGHGAPFYVSGFIAPAYHGYSAVVHLVQTRSGSAVLSLDVALGAIDDVENVARLLEQRISTENRPIALNSPAPKPAASAAATVRPRVDTAPSFPASQSLPVGSISVFDSVGPGIDAQRAYVGDTLALLFSEAGQAVKRLRANGPIDVADAALLCSSTGSTALAFPAMERAESRDEHWTVQRLRLTVVDCADTAKARVADAEGSGRTWKEAADGAIARAMHDVGK